MFYSASLLLPSISRGPTSCYTPPISSSHSSQETPIYVILSQSQSPAKPPPRPRPASRYTAGFQYSDGKTLHLHAVSVISLFVFSQAREKDLLDCLTQVCFSISLQAYLNVTRLFFMWIKFETKRFFSSLVITKGSCSTKSLHKCYKGTTVPMIQQPES